VRLLMQVEKHPNFFSLLSIFNSHFVCVSMFLMDNGHKARLEESGDGHGEAVHVEHGQQQQPVLPCIKSSKFLQVMRTAFSIKSCDTVPLNFAHLDLMIFDAVRKVSFS
jgi:hypothetical protein